MEKMENRPLKEICEKAMAVGSRIDLSDCPYGETTGPSAFLKRPANYYFFLAGLTRTERLTRVLEIGTNYGGSIMSIAKGIPEDLARESRLVTIDILLKNDKAFRQYPNIRRIKGDSLDGDTACKALESFEGQIDLLYVDSIHEYGHTKGNIDIYAGKLNPRYVVLDDIRQCIDMMKLWMELKEEFGENAFDASNVAIRKGAGFGVIRMG